MKLPKRLPILENLKAEYSTVNDLVQKYIGNRFSMKIGSGKNSSAQATEEFIRGQIFDFALFYYRDSDFMYNYLDSQEQIEYNDVMQKYCNDLIEYSGILAIMEKNDDCIMLDENFDTYNQRELKTQFFRDYKNQIPEGIIRKYIKYRKTYAGEDITI